MVPSTSTQAATSWLQQVDDVVVVDQRVSQADEDLGQRLLAITDAPWSVARVVVHQPLRYAS